jgi:hypothetical protein
MAARQLLQGLCRLRSAFVKYEDLHLFCGSPYFKNSICYDLYGIIISTYDSSLEQHIKNIHRTGQKLIKNMVHLMRMYNLVVPQFHAWNYSISSHPPTPHPFIHPSIHPCTYPPPTHSFIHSSIHPPTPHSFIHSSIHPSTHPFIHSFISIYLSIYSPFVGPWPFFFQFLNHIYNR